MVVEVYVGRDGTLPKVISEQLQLLTLAVEWKDDHTEVRLHVVDIRK